MSCVFLRQLLKTGPATKQVESLWKQTTLAVFYFFLSGSQFFWKSSKENRMWLIFKTNNTIPYVNKLTFSKILMSKLILPNLLFTFLRLLQGYKSAIVDINSTSTGRFLGSSLSNQLSLWSDNSLKTLSGLLAVDYFK